MFLGDHEIHETHEKGAQQGALHAIKHGTIVSKPVAAEWAKGQMLEQAQWIETALRSQSGGGAGFAPEALNFIRLVKDRVDP